MYEEPRKQKFARIIEVPIPIEYWDMLEDLIVEYGNPEDAILEAIKSHHKERWGTFEEISVKPSFSSQIFRRKSHQISTPITSGKISKITENGKKFEQRTQKDIAKFDELLDKLKVFIEETKEKGSEAKIISVVEEDKEKKESLSEEEGVRDAKFDQVLEKLDGLISIDDLKNEITSLKSIVSKLGTTSVRTRGKYSDRRADLSSLDLTINETVDKGLLAPPERPALDDVLDSVLLFDDSDLDEEEENKKNK